MPIPPIFLSHAGEDAEAVRLLSRRLKEAGFAVWLDVERMRAGESWMACQERALRQAGAWCLFIGKQDVGTWLDREGRLALERSFADPAFRVIPILGRGADPERMPLWLSRHPGLDLRGRMPEPADLRRIFGTVFEQSPQRGHPLEDGENPFQGLAPFGSERSHLFFGRDEEVDQMLEAMVASPFLALVGQAGSGKTSLLQAGLLPALRRGRFHAGDRWVERWRIAYMRPQDDPFRELAKALPDLGPDLEPLARQELRRKAERKLNAGVEGLEECVHALVGAGTRSLIVVDQFEELFTRTERPELRRRFLDGLFRAMGGSGDRQVHVLLSMRADYYGHAFEHARLPGLLARNQFPLRSPHASLIKEIVEKPTHWAGARLQQGLLARILDAAAEPGAGLV
jgi:Novel STAND NTPase 1/TIR domain